MNEIDYAKEDFTDEYFYESNQIFEHKAQTTPRRGVEKKRHSLADETEPTSGSKKCIHCQKKFTSKYPLGICRDCFHELMISRTTAKNIYKLTDDDFDSLDFNERPTIHHNVGKYYFLKDVRLIAIEKRYSITNPSHPVYKKHIKKIIRDVKEKKEERAKNRKPRTVTDNARSVIRIINSRDEYYDFDNSDSDFEPEETDEQIRRRNRLRGSLEKRGLSLRSDSFYCNLYIRSHKFKLKEVVKMMIMMDFFMNKTSYKTFLRNIYDNDPIGNYYGERRSITETDKEYAKKNALKKYLKEHGKKLVPEVVLENYL